MYEIQTTFKLVLHILLATDRLIHVPWCVIYLTESHTMK